MTSQIGPMSARMQTYVINLDRAPERMAKMQARLSEIALPFQRYAAVDGRALTFPHPQFSDIGYRLLHGRRRAPAEIGCYLSHVGVMVEFLASDAEFALVLEDDITFQPDFIQAIAAALARSGEWDILRLSTVNSARAIAYGRLSDGRKIGVALTREKGAGAYIVNRKAARWITGLVPMRLAYDIAFDLEYLAGMRAAFICPPPCAQITGEVTQIQNQGPDFKLPKWRYLTVLPYRAWLEITRLVMRLIHLTHAALREIARR